MRALHVRHGAAFLLLWSPGPPDHPLHRGGDDKKAREIVEAAQPTGLAWPTHELCSLVAGLAACDRVVCSDGSAMHIAAALGKPIVCFFCNSDARRWRPRGVPHVPLQPGSLDVTDVSVDQALGAYESLAALAPAG